mgnify:CR=1 FL=1
MLTQSVCKGLSSFTDNPWCECFNETTTTSDFVRVLHHTYCQNNPVQTQHFRKINHVFMLKCLNREFNNTWRNTDLLRSLRLVVNNMSRRCLLRNNCKYPLPSCNTKVTSKSDYHGFRTKLIVSALKL